ncbi:MAG: hypothetical protein K2X39_07445 [Silvanigrellaceae bacterium]|nr:hypothetical protein [Silvanigrellaceae bacterium]
MKKIIFVVFSIMYSFCSFGQSAEDFYIYNQTLQTFVGDNIDTFNRVQDINQQSLSSILYASTHSFYYASVYTAARFRKNFPEGVVQQVLNYPSRGGAAEINWELFPKNVLETSLASQLNTPFLGFLSTVRLFLIGAIQNHKLAFANLRIYPPRTNGYKLSDLKCRDTININISEYRKALGSINPSAITAEEFKQLTTNIISKGEKQIYSCVNTAQNKTIADTVEISKKVFFNRIYTMQNKKIKEINEFNDKVMADWEKNYQTTVDMGGLF